VFRQLRLPRVNGEVKFLPYPMISALGAVTQDSTAVRIVVAHAQRYNGIFLLSLLTQCCFEHSLRKLPFVNTTSCKADVCIAQAIGVRWKARSLPSLSSLQI
jgi:hypothetical protein